jgi:hypothetical protein
LPNLADPATRVRLTPAAVAAIARRAEIWHLTGDLRSPRGRFRPHPVPDERAVAIGGEQAQQRLLEPPGRDEAHRVALREIRRIGSLHTANWRLFKGSCLPALVGLTDAPRVI